MSVVSFGVEMCCVSFMAARFRVDVLPSIGFMSCGLYFGRGERGVRDC